MSELLNILFWASLFAAFYPFPLTHSLYLNVLVLVVVVWESHNDLPPTDQATPPARICHQQQLITQTSMKFFNTVKKIHQKSQPW